MGVDTVGYTIEMLPLKEIASLLEQKLGAKILSINKSESMDKFFKEHYNKSADYVGFIDFSYDMEVRSLFVGITRDCEQINNEPCTSFSLGYHGNSVPLIHSIVEEFGGYLIPKDTADEVITIKPTPGRTEEEFWAHFLQQ